MLAHVLTKNDFDHHRTHTHRLGNRYEVRIIEQTPAKIWIWMTMNINHTIEIIIDPEFIIICQTSSLALVITFFSNAK